MRRHTQVQDQVFPRQIVNSVFQMFNPRQKICPFLRWHSSRLMRKVRRNIPIRQHDRSSAQRRHDFGLRLEPVSGVEQCGKMRIHFVQWPQIPVQELPDHAAEPRLILRKPGGIDSEPARGQVLLEQTHLRVLPAAVYAFNCDQFSARCHTVANSLFDSLTAPVRRCNDARTPACCIGVLR